MWVVEKIEISGGFLPGLSVNLPQGLTCIIGARGSGKSTLAEADEMAQRRKLLGEAMTRLNEREREILIERRLRDEPLTLEDLSRRFHVSRERIRQLEVRAVDKLRKGMLDDAKTIGLPADLAAA